jgi:hypothetical protein
MAKDGNFGTGLLIGLGIAVAAVAGFALGASGSPPSSRLLEAPEPRPRFDGGRGGGTRRCDQCGVQFAVTPLLQRWISLGAPPFCGDCLGRLFVEHLRRE